MKEFRRKKRTSVTAVQLDLDTEGFTYRKWDGTQHCKRGDWLVNSQGDVYTVDGDTFDRTYRMVSPGVYEKSAPVWAERAEKPGTITTREGFTTYQAGDYVVFNHPSDKDGYAMTSKTFHSLYEPCED